MGEVLGLGVSHYPPLSGNDADMANILRRRLDDPDVPAELKDPAGWPALMREEWGDDEGVAGATRHRENMVAGIRRVRQELDDFNPDFVLIWGDDQYENFKEDIVPPFCIHIYDDMKLKPWAQAAESAVVGGRPNAWNEDADTEILVRGHPEAGKAITCGLIEAEFDISYAYQPLHHPGLAHAFLNAILYLDYDRKGFNYPVVPMQINCYGDHVISYRGFVSQLADRGRPLDPPAPSPRRCFDMGAQIARICRDSDWRVALIASSSWSHAFLNDESYRMQPNVEFDRTMYNALTAGDFDTWRNTLLSDITRTGNQEMLNWMALLGAMKELGQTCAWSEFVETYCFNSSKVAAVFPPR